MIDTALLLQYLVLCLIIFILDIRYRWIPDFITIPGIIFAIFVNSTVPDLIGFNASVFGTIAGWGSIFVAGIFCFALSKKPGLGGGDLKLLAMIGAFWGWKVALLSFAIAPIFGSLYAIIFNQTALPYGAFLIACSLLNLALWK